MKTGSGNSLEKDLDHDPPCHPRACAIQSEFASLPQQLVLILRDCLMNNNYKEERCQKAVDALYECCNAFYEKQGDDATTTSCPKPNLLRLKLKQRGMASGT